MKRSSQSGFTLTEMLVALFITGIVSAAGAALLVSASQTGRQLDAFSDNLQDLEVGQALIRNDMAALVPVTYDPKDEFGVSGGLAWRPVQTSGPLMQFYRNGWLQPQETPVQSDLQAVEYVIDSGKLIRITHLPGARPDALPRRELFKDVDRVELRIFEDAAWRDAPVSNLLSQTRWPELVEMTIFFEDDRSFQIVSLSGVRG